MTNQELVKRAFEMHRFSYVPYSHFPVGAALLAGNVENAAYGSTICAERTALLKAVSEGCREGWTAIAIAGQGADFCWPCGACRQMLYEFAPDLRVLAARGDGQYAEARLSELLPHGFGPRSLK